MHVKLQRIFRLFLSPIHSRYLQTSAAALFHISSKSYNNHFALTGIQPSGKPHLGNYLAVLKPCLRLIQEQRITKFFMLVADLHALTSVGGSELSNGIRELTAAIVACGFRDIDNSKCSVFLQSDVHGHCELSWILSTQCYTSRLAHLPQWREKSRRFSPSQGGVEANSVVDAAVGNNTVASVGVFTYPVLQAADILLYGAGVVPIGADQVTHIEVARDLVRNCVNRWPALAKLLTVPEGLVLGVPKINSLRNPEKKMSKSDPSETGCIFLMDTPDIIRQKFRRAQTDSIPSITYDPQGRPGVSNLLRILAAIQSVEIDQLMVEACRWNKEILKSTVTDAVVNELAPIRQRMLALSGTADGRCELEHCLRTGSKEANRVASSRLRSIYSSIGCGLTRQPVDEKGLPVTVGLHGV